MTEHRAPGTEPSRDSGPHPSPSTEHNDADDEISLLDLLVVIAENLRLLVLGPLLAGFAALGIAFLIPPSFTARTSFLPPQQQQSTAAAVLAQFGTLAGAAASAAGIKNPVDQFVSLLKSETVADRLIDRFKLMELYRAKYLQDARMALANKTNVSSGKDGLIVVEVSDVSPQRAADIANAYVAELKTLMGRLALTEAQQRRAFFEKNLENTKARLVDAERALSTAGVNAAAMKANPQTAVALVAQLMAQVTAQEVKLSAMRGYLSDSAPDFRQAQTELQGLRAQLQKEQATEPRLFGPGDYIEKYRNFKYQETLFELFVRQFDSAKADESREGALIQVIDAAQPPEKKSGPKRAAIAALAALATGLILLVWVFARKAFVISASHPNYAIKIAEIRAGLLRLFSLKRERR